MKNIHISFMVLALSIASTSVQAADGTITINGRILDSTCTITNSITPTTNADFTIQLPGIAKGLFQSNALTAGDTPFSITLTSCPLGEVAVRFDHTHLNIDSAGLLKNTSTDTTPATNIGIQILKDTTPLILNNANAGLQATTITTSAPSATFNYVARYKATVLPVTAGPVQSAITYFVVYP